MVTAQHKFPSYMTSYSFNIGFSVGKKSRMYRLCTYTALGTEAYVQFVRFFVDVCLSYYYAAGRRFEKSYVIGAFSADLVCSV